MSVNYAYIELGSKEIDLVPSLGSNLTALIFHFYHALNYSAGYLSKHTKKACLGICPSVGGSSQFTPDTRDNNPAWIL
jgi:hypothetical protein